MSSTSEVWGHHVSGGVLMRHHQQQITMVLKEEWGKSLLEVIIVLSIVVATTLVIGEAFLGATRTTHLRAVQKNVAMELRTARQWALIKRKAIRVTMVVGKSHIRTDIRHPSGRPLRQYGFSDKGIMVKKVSNGPQIVFYPSGRAATPTTITLQDLRGRQLLLTVSMTGRVIAQ